MMGDASDNLESTESFISKIESAESLSELYGILKREKPPESVEIAKTIMTRFPQLGGNFKHFIEWLIDEELIEYFLNLYEKFILNAVGREINNSLYLVSHLYQRRSAPEREINLTKIDDALLARSSDIASDILSIDWESVNSLYQSIKIVPSLKDNENILDALASSLEEYLVMDNESFIYYIDDDNLEPELGELIDALEPIRSLPKVQVEMYHYARRWGNHDMQNRYINLFESNTASDAASLVFNSEKPWRVTAIIKETNHAKNNQVRKAIEARMGYIAEQVRKSGIEEMFVDILDDIWEFRGPELEDAVRESAEEVIRAIQEGEDFQMAPEFSSYYQSQVYQKLEDVGIDVEDTYERLSAKVEEESQR
jgi:hypothetical protein